MNKHFFPFIIFTALPYHSTPTGLELNFWNWLKMLRSKNIIK